MATYHLLCIFTFFLWFLLFSYSKWKTDGTIDTSYPIFHRYQNTITLWNYILAQNTTYHSIPPLHSWTKDYINLHHPYINLHYNTMLTYINLISNTATTKSIIILLKNGIRALWRTWTNSAWAFLNSFWASLRLTWSWYIFLWYHWFGNSTSTHIK